MTGYSSFSCLIFRYKSELKGPWWWCSSGQHPRSLNLAKVYNFSVKIVVEKDENKQKEAGVVPLLKEHICCDKCLPICPT